MKIEEGDYSLSLPVLMELATGGHLIIMKPIPERWPWHLAAKSNVQDSLIGVRRHLLASVTF